MKREEEEEQTIPDPQTDPDPTSSLGKGVPSNFEQTLSQLSSAVASAPRFNLTPRTDEEIYAASRRIPQESRPKDPAALAKLRSRATVGIDPPFTFLDLDNTDLTLQHDKSLQSVRKTIAKLI